jgi:tripartite-type tricarboxylate transporter receptor subunit TctC
LAPFFLICLYGYNLSWAAEKEYPNQPIKIIIPYEPGGVFDLSIRVLSEYLARELKVPVIIENRAGASGMLGADLKHCLGYLSTHKSQRSNKHWC